jgi:hypothetical protein
MTYLLKKGNLVFKTIHDTGCVDIVAIDKRGKIHLYDVKTLKVELLMVDLEEERCWIIKHGGREESLDTVKK